MPYSARFGRLAFVTIENNLVETLGNTLTTIGGGVAAGERRARPLSLAVPVRGVIDPNLNAVANPSAETTSSPWNGFNGSTFPTVTRVTTDGPPGVGTSFELASTPSPNALQIYTDGDLIYVSPGDVLTISAYFKGVSGPLSGFALYTRNYNAAGGVVAQDLVSFYPTSTLGVWVPLSGLYTVPAGTAAINLSTFMYATTASVFRSSVHSIVRQIDPYAVGNKLRRQARAMFDNDTYLLNGVPFSFSVDPELDGWLVMAGGELSYSDGGVTLADYSLELRDAYKVGSRWTHRSARRLEVYDTRAGTVPRDILGIFYSTDYSSFLPMAAIYFHALPVGVSDVTGQLASTIAPLSVTGQGGITPMIYNRTHGEVVSFEHSQTNEGLNDVVILDRRGRTLPSGSPSDSQTAYGWEEVYGRNYPLTPGDLPVIQNGHARVRWNAASSGLILEWWTAGAWSELGRVCFLDPFPAVFTNLRSVTVHEWTPEKAIVRFAMASGISRADIFVMLGRGWFGPRVEVYAGYNQQTVIRYVPSISGNYVHSGGTVSSWTGTRSFTGIEPWAYIQGAASGDQMNFAVVDKNVIASFSTDNQQYGSTRNCVDFVRGPNVGRIGHLSVRFGAAPRNTSTLDSTMVGAKGVAIHNLFDARAIPELVSR